MVPLFGAHAPNAIVIRMPCDCYCIVFLFSSLSSPIFRYICACCVHVCLRVCAYECICVLVLVRICQSENPENWPRRSRVSIFSAQSQFSFRTLHTFTSAATAKTRPSHTLAPQSTHVNTHAKGSLSVFVRATVRHYSCRVKQEASPRHHNHG